MGTVTKMEKKMTQDHSEGGKPKKTIIMPGQKAARKTSRTKPETQASRVSDTNASSGSKSGARMDRKVERQANPFKKYGVPGLVAAAVLFLGYTALDLSGGRVLSVNENRILVSDVTLGVYEDFIPVRGRVTPLKTVFLDAIEGGRVEKVHVEDGAALKPGDLIVELSNTGLQLDVTRNEALVTEQLNTMRTIELQLEQNRLGHKRNLVEINYQIKKLTRQVSRERELIATGAVSGAQLQDSEDDLEYYINRRDVTLESQKTDARMQSQQLVFLKEAGSQLQENLHLSRQNLDALKVRAPVAGKLSGFDVEIGQSITRGGRLGQIDDPDQFKVRAEIDEFYLGRVDIGQTASLDRGSDRYDLRISKIYPQVNDGQFEVDMVFTGATPDGIRRGQTMQTRLTLGDSTEALLIPNGAFWQDTGGNWIFVVTPDGGEAVRRNVKLGRRNSRFIEVLDGLEQGEKVVTSPYSGYHDMDRLKLN